MVDEKITELTTLVTIDNADVLAVVDDVGGAGEETKQITVANFLEPAVKVDGSNALTANWDAGSYKITAETFESDVATGTAPLIVASTTVVANLNADQVDGYDLDQSVETTGEPTFRKLTISYASQTTDLLVVSGSTSDSSGVHLNFTCTNSSVVYGVLSEQSISPSGNITNAYGWYLSPYFAGGNNMTLARSFYVRAAIDAAYSGTITSLITLEVGNPNYLATNPATTYSIVIRDSDGSTTSYGLYIDHITNASTNYAIYTGDGEVRFGDDTRIIDAKKLLLGTGGDGEIYSSSDNLYIANVTSNKDIIFQVNDGGVTTTMMTMDADVAKIGIGTSSPQELLHLYNTAGTCYVEVESGSTGGVGYIATNTAGSWSWYVTTSGNIYFRDITNNKFMFLIEANVPGEMLRLGSDGRVGIREASPGALLHVRQPGSVAGIAVLQLEQLDVDVAFTKYQGTAAASTLTRSLVDEGDQTSETREGWIKVEILDDGNQITDGSYFVPFYSLS